VAALGGVLCVGVTGCDKKPAEATPDATSDAASPATTDGGQPADPVDAAAETPQPEAGQAPVKRPKRGPDPALSAPVFSTQHRAMRRRFVLQRLADSMPSGDLVALDAGTVLVASHKKLHVVAAESGKVIASVDAPGRIIDGPRRFGDAFWVLTADGRAAGYSAAKPTAGVTTNLRLEGDLRRLVGFAGGKVVTVNKAARGDRYELAAYPAKPNTKRALKPDWNRTPKVNPGWQWLVRLHGTRLILPDAKRIVALEATSGGVRWMWRTPNEPAPGVLANGFYELVHQGNFLQLDATTGKVALRIPLAEAPTSEFAAAGKRRYYGTKTKTVAIDLTTQKPVWSASVPSSAAPMVGEEWVWTIAGDTVTALDKASGKAVCTWNGYNGTKPTLVGEGLVFIESPSRRLVGIGCDPAPRKVPEGGACKHLQRCCGAIAQKEAALGRACANVLARILDMGVVNECRKALLTYAKDLSSPAVCRKPPPPPRPKAKPAAKPPTP